MQIELKHDVKKNVLLLQGPVGYFFDKLRSALREAGAKNIVKVNYNLADSFFYKTGMIEEFNQPMHHLPVFYHELLEKYKIEAIYLFGDCRPIHKMAIDVFKAFGVDIYVFEEGYLRPNFMTLEKGGVNGNSSMPKTLTPMRDIEKSEKIGHHKQIGYGSFKKMMSFAIIYFSLIYLGKKKFPFYKHHKPVCVYDALCWLISYMRKPVYRIIDRPVQQHLVKKYHKKYFFVPLQLYNDAQVKNHSNYSDVLDFLEDILVSFARYAADDKRLVIKHHPFDRGHRQYKSFIKKRATALGIQERVYYLHEVNVAKCLRNACGTVVINSTVGLSSLLHHIPVKVMGAACYDIQGLTYQGCLSDFWTSPGTVNDENYQIFRNYILQKTQIEGSFYG